MATQTEIQFPRGFGSDNHAPVHPKIMEALSQCNHNHAPSYGTDLHTLECNEVLKSFFGPQTESFFVFNGTGANVAALQAMVRSFETVVSTDVAHINVDECAAPEITGKVKIISVPNVNGKLTPNEVRKTIIRRGDQHFAQVRAISITQPTELGTLYSLQEIRDLVQVARENDLLVHMDGARFANACAALKVTPREMTTDLGIDILTFGGTKNSLMFGEIVVILNPKLQKNFSYIRKQICQLPSKSRYFAAQFLAYFNDSLWLEIAEHSLQMAKLLAENVHNIPGVQVSYPVESNVVFAKIPKSWVKPLRKKYFFYVWDETEVMCRWMTSWDTQTEEISGLTAALKDLSAKESCRTP